jgi:GNAT superfamily N-acetyltransferase
MDYTVTEITDLQNSQVVDLHAQLLGGGRAMSRSYLRWKYCENPFLTSPIFLVVRYGHQIVGMRGLVGTCWISPDGKNLTTVPHVDDLIIHPQHRNHGLFLRIHQATVTAAKERGFSELISLSGGVMTQKLSLACGWQSLGPLERIHRCSSHPRISLGIRIPALRRGHYLLRRIRSRIGLIRFRLPSDRSLDRAFDNLVSKASPRIQLASEADYAAMSSLSESTASGLVRAPRSETFLRWRLNNPHRKYRFVFWRDSRLRGYLVLAWSEKRNNRVMIADYAVENICVFNELLDALVQPKTGQLRMMSSTVPDEMCRSAETAGFERDPNFEKDIRRRFLVYRTAESTCPDSLALPASAYPDRFRVSLLDTMHA